MDNVCNRRLFSFPTEVEIAEEQEYLRLAKIWVGKLCWRHSLQLRMRWCLRIKSGNHNDQSV